MPQHTRTQRRRRAGPPAARLRSAGQTNRPGVVASPGGSDRRHPCLGSVDPRHPQGTLRGHPLPQHAASASVSLAAWRRPSCPAAALRPPDNRVSHAKSGSGPPSRIEIERGGGKEVSRALP